MKKNIVFVIPSLSAGGAEKSLVNLLNTIDYDVYNVDLLVFSKSGLFLSMLPSQVTILELNDDFNVLSKKLIVSCLIFFKQLKFKLIYHRISFAFKNKFYKNKAIAEQNSWNNIQSSISILNKKYDAAIGFLEKTSIYFTVDKIVATKKIGWIHTNYSNSGMSAVFDKNYFQKLDALIGVSSECCEDLRNNFPSLKEKIKVIYNIVSTSVIKSLSEKKIDDFILSETQNQFLTIARLSYEKGIDLALESSKLLKEKDIKFQWLIIGDGQERVSLEAKIKEYQLENNFILLGLKENPYPYLKKCSLYIQPSRYEGKSMAIDEAKILKKPIIVTNFTTAKDQIDHLKNGIIVEQNSKAIAEEIINLLNDKLLADFFSLNLSKENFGTEAEIQKLYDLIND